jgi:hypothetical protein
MDNQYHIETIIDFDESKTGFYIRGFTINKTGEDQNGKLFNRVVKTFDDVDKQVVRDYIRDNLN